MKILVSDKLSARGEEILKQGGLQVDVKTGLKPEELKEIIGEYDGLVVRSATKATAEIIAAGKKLKVIGRAGAGVDNIDSEAASKQGIVVMNTPGGNTVTTGEHAIAMLMSLTRFIPQATASMKAQKWDKKSFEGREVFNKTLGIVGIGRVGTIVATRAIGLKMNVIAYDPFISKEAADNMGVELVSLDELYAKSDYISVHTPKSKDTVGLLGKEAFAKMKKGVMVINCARGGIVDEKALIEALDSGKVAGAAVDVFEKEPPEDWTLPLHPKVICTPHLGASTEEAQENVAIAVAEQMVDYLNNGVIRNAVNAPSVGPDMLPKVKPYIELAEKMGLFMGQLISGRIRKVTVNYCGAASGIDTKPVTISMLKGLFTAIMDDVNFINAPIIAKDRGIEVVESKTEKEEIFTNTLELVVQLDTGKRYLAGAVFTQDDLRIVKIDNYPIEVTPEGNMLVIYNKDLPGTVGKIASTLGDDKINIARLFLGRDKKKGTAIIIINLDAEVPESVAEKIRNVSNTLSVQKVTI